MKIFLIIFISSLTLIFLKTDELSVFKALVCANIITRKEVDEDKEVNSLSPILLTCYIKINDAQIQRLTEGIDKGFDSILSEEEMNDLIDIDSLKDLSEQEVKKKGDELEEAIKDLQKIQEGYSENGEDDGYDDGDDDYDEYDEGPKNNISRKGFFRLIKNGIFNFGSIVLSSWYIICILVVFYLLLLEIRRNNRQESVNSKKEKETKDDKDNSDKKNEKSEEEEKKENEDNKEKSKETENIKKDENENKYDNKKEKLD